jgi:hypothetical protein
VDRREELMAEPSPSLQLCPTRIDGAPVLFAHKVTQGQCQDRQRGQYHKCFTCVYNNAYVQKNGSPSLAETAAVARIIDQRRAQVG